jgi:hypothetical protein
MMTIGRDTVGVAAVAVRPLYDQLTGFAAGCGLARVGTGRERKGCEHEGS